MEDGLQKKVTEQYVVDTLNEELAGMLGVSIRTVTRKAKELGLKKDKQWLVGIWNERRIWANVASKRMGYPGSIQKGEHRSPETEFKKKCTV